MLIFPIDEGLLTSDTESKNTLYKEKRLKNLWFPMIKIPLPFIKPLWVFLFQTSVETRQPNQMKEISQLFFSDLIYLVVFIPIISRTTRFKNCRHTHEMKH